MPLICQVCSNRGMDGGCIFCGKKKKQRKTQKDRIDLIKAQAERERYAFLLATWTRLQTFRMPSCGHAPLDQELKDWFGEWL